MNRGLLGGLRSQVRNIAEFRTLFPPLRLARGLATFPLDYVSPSGAAAPPMVINLLASGRCNLKCELCWATQRRPGPEMTAAQIERVVRQSLPWRPTWFVSGGEPLARSDLEEVVGVIKSHGLPVGMVTNGVALSPARGQALKDAGLDALIVSLHGPEETHDLVTGVPGSFQRTLRNLRAFCEGPRRTRVMINVVLTRETALAMDDLAALGRSVGADHVRFEHLLFLTPAEQAAHDAEAPRAPGRDLSVQTWLCEPEVPGTLPPDLVQRLRTVEERHGSFVSVKPALGPAEVAAWYTDGYRSRRRCFFLWRSLFLDPEGNVLPCQHYARMRFGNVLREPITEIWNSPRYRWMRRRIRAGLLPGCSRCVKL